MSKNEEFGGLLGAYMEGMRQAYYPVFSGNAQPRKVRQEKVPVKKAEACQECCSQMKPALCAKS